jgi:hypothetical protein
LPKVVERVHRVEVAHEQTTNRVDKFLEIPVCGRRDAGLNERVQFGAELLDVCFQADYLQGVDEEEEIFFEW